MQTNKVRLGIVDPPAGECRHVNVSFVSRRNGDRCAVPLEKTFVDPIDFLNEGELEMQSRLGDRIPDWLSELSDDYLLGLVNGEETSEQGA